MNVFIFSGNLGGDAVTRFTPDGKPVTSFSVASTSGWGDKKVTTWIRCNAWGERYQKIAGYLVKGKKVTVSGEFFQREWQAQDGVTKYSCEVRVNDLDLPPLDNAGTGAQQGYQAPQQQPQQRAPQQYAPSQGAPAQHTAPPPGPDFFDDSIPF